MPAAVQQPAFAHPLQEAPHFFKQWPAWAAWSAPQKRPLDLRRALKGASVTDPDTWTTYDQALRHLQRIAPPVPYAFPIPVGVGILIAPPIIFVDFDDLLDSYGNAPLWATEFIDHAIRLGAFAEKSASGQGAHVFLRATPELILKRNRYTRSHPSSTPVGIEIYQRERFAALTGVRIGSSHPNENLNDPSEGDKLLLAFLAELDAKAAPILTPDLPPAPLEVPRPTQPVLDLLPQLLTHGIRQAFADPASAYTLWQQKRAQSGGDSSLSAWRFSLFLEASRVSSVSPLPVYELFNPQSTPAHPGVHDWQEFSGHNKKPHRRYADIQRAHAMVVEELRLLALDLGQEPEAPPPPQEPQEQIEPQDPTWAQLGLVMGKIGNAIRPLPTTVNFQRVLSRHPMFAMNRIERNLLDGVTLFNRQSLQDSQVTRWLEPLRAVLGMIHDPSPESVRAVVEVIADDNPYDPLVESLNALPKWTPPENYHPENGLLSNWLEKIGAVPSQDIKKFSRRIILGLVARALRPGVKFDYVPVFEGPQGVGKSTLVKTLVGTNFYATLFGGLHQKDALMTLRGKWGVEISELAAFKKTDNETMKSFFSTDTDVFRPPYARAMVSLPRRTVLFGTTNDAQYLTDHTGARRFMPICFPKAIDLAWLREHRDELFAEAVYALNQGERFHETLEELSQPDRQAQLQKRMVLPAWQQKLIHHLRSLPTPHLPDDTGMAFNGVVTTQYVLALQKTLDLPSTVLHLHTAQLGNVVERAGYVRLRLSYRPPKAEATKLTGWMHPSLARLAPDQLKAFLGQFPDLFVGKAPPATWFMLEAEHLHPAVEELKKAPLLAPLDFNDEHG